MSGAMEIILQMHKISLQEKVWVWKQIFIKVAPRNHNTVTAGKQYKNKIEV